jgi:ABC-type transport system involved in cytochrome c biogenesis permease subunit
MPCSEMPSSEHQADDGDAFVSDTARTARSSIAIVRMSGVRYSSVPVGVSLLLALYVPALKGGGYFRCGRRCPEVVSAAWSVGAMRATVRFFLGGSGLLIMEGVGWWGGGVKSVLPQSVH